MEPGEGQDMNNLEVQIIREEVVAKLKDFASQVGAKLSEQQALVGKVVEAFQSLDARITLLEQSMTPKSSIPEAPVARSGKEL